MNENYFIELTDEVSDFLRKKCDYEFSVLADYVSKSSLEKNSGKIVESLSKTKYELSVRIITNENDYLIALDNFDDWKYRLSRELKKIKGKRVDFFLNDKRDEVFFKRNIFDKYSSRDIKSMLNIKAERYHARMSYLAHLRIFQTANSRILQYFPRSSFSITMLSKKIPDTVSQTAAKIGFLEGLNVEETVSNANSLLKDLESSKPLSGGVFDIVADSKLTATFVHEAVGHASEGDLVKRQESCLYGKLNKKIASDVVSIYDSSVVEDEPLWGSFAYDDEGNPAKKTKIVDSGYLRNYLTNLKVYHEFAKDLGLNNTSNARAMDPFNFPLVRMTNTYIEKGDHSEEELLEELREGLYLKSSLGGQVNTTEGTFQFYTQLGYVVKNGKILYPIKGASLKGNILTTLKNIECVGKKYGQDSVGTCGKGAQSVPVGGRNPSILIRSALIGGTNER
ncbi:MAG: TldD/PmbA family protein [Candidatus Woesearchaeota archaeon]